MDKEHLSSFFEALQVSNDGSYCRKCDDMMVPLGNPEDMAAFAGCTNLADITILNKGTHVGPDCIQ